MEGLLQKILPLMQVRWTLVTLLLLAPQTFRLLLKEMALFFMISHLPSMVMTPSW